MRCTRARWATTAGAVALLVGCSTTTELGGAATSTAASGAPTTSISSAVPMTPEACAYSRDTLEVAADAFMAINGSYAETMQQLVEANLLMSAPDDVWTYTYAPGDRDYVIAAVSGGPCD